jgi:hypothetical protein
MDEKLTRFYNSRHPVEPWSVACNICLDVKDALLRKQNETSDR